MRANTAIRLVFWVAVTVLGPPGSHAASAPAERASITFPNGAVYRVEIPRDKRERERGLMFRRKLPARTGMLFVFPASDRHPIWMKNCKIALDLIWLDDARRIVAILPEAPPCPGDPCPIYQPDRPSRYVLEIAAGAAKREGLVVGSLIQFDPPT